MGTRHLILVFYQGDYHIAQYGQLDGYPSGEGVRILEFASTSNNLTMLKFSISKGLLYTPTNEQLQAWKAQAFDLGQERQHQVLTNPASVNWEEHRKYPMEVVCPSIAAHISAGILQLVANSADPVPIVKHLDFIADLLYCEWAYVLDLDEHVLEVYCPGARPIEGLESSRFDALECVKKLEKKGITMVAKFKLDELPDADEFVRRCNGGSDDSD
ncbi:hypothetical protein GTA08_BOTSDO09870 [Botryosphaeria dothidea]|uniref:Uncharacterized protein n=1 Tax=Botryosphaeria dothidea TaxID=55169 RepID=A0A8H4IJE2_9PEZI|nr:hypothetical protein GTA08_BOTSDO09870 [Botryosphaeria dothidea]